MLADQVWQEAFGAPKPTQNAPWGTYRLVLLNRYRESPSRRIYQGSLGG
jgi:hypothetical protein